jgi:hypothetical protein
MFSESINEHRWSDWRRFDDTRVLEALPDDPGVYEVRTDFEIGRLHGSSSLVTIGRAKNLRDRRDKQKVGDTTRYLNRAEKWLLKENHVLEFRYLTCDSFEDAKHTEAVRQLEYESQHWELPPGNDRLELSPIKKRIKDEFGVSTDLIVRDLLRGKLEVPQVAAKLNVSPAIINNLIVYFGEDDS